jgi:outer membrane lipoprotein SlyB
MASNAMRAVVLLAPFAVIGCAVVPPSAPSVMALPKQGEDFGVFRAHDASCRDYAASQIGYGAGAERATQDAVGSAAVGTAIGAVAGAALGSLSGNVGAGAAVGAGAGLLAGSAVGANRAQYSAGQLQYMYDTAYTQCMVAHGYTVRRPPPRPVVVAPAYPYGYYPAPYPYGYGVTFGFGPWHRWHHWHHWHHWRRW